MRWCASCSNKRRKIERSWYVVFVTVKTLVVVIVSLIPGVEAGEGHGEAAGSNDGGTGQLKDDGATPLTLTLTPRVTQQCVLPDIND